ncbi:uncharacterized protein F21D5.5-like [Wyeomyia smithii]|uniref:uncharacterized protein F21D5.5-like n=1 Tax=Wyeomyia smithii TaxID=174621 RepID=UPI002467E204|nr:uncharacterized protein F21D5.5-like [Wyeomyia smithii]
MNKVLKECFLKSITDRHPPIRIDPVFTFVGRSPVTLIQDPCCSRVQVGLKAYFKDGFVLVKCLGLNPSVLNGIEMLKHEVYEAYDGDILELLPDNYKYVFDFKFEEVVKCQVGEKLPENETCSKTENPINQDENKNSRDTSEYERDISDDELISMQNKRARLSKQKTTVAENSLWEEIDGKQLFVFHSKGLVSSENIAAYDLDGTLIKTKSGNVFPRNIDDWKFAFPEVVEKLKSLWENGSKIVIFTDQNEISKGKLEIDAFKRKIEALQKTLSIPLQAFISTGEGKYRKPLTGMWDSLCQLYNDGLQVDKVRSFYVGDAAGRLEQNEPVKRKKDRSCADRFFASNVGIPFFTPEVHFQNSEDIAWARPIFDPQSVSEFSNLLSPSGTKLVLPTQEIIIMVGFPGSGKTHFIQAHLEPKGYTLIDRDTLGTWQKFVLHLENTLQNQKSAVIDNTNPDAHSRKRVIKIARKRSVTCRCFVMGAGYKHSKHNITFRELIDRSQKSIDELEFNLYKSRYQQPSTKEGFSEVVEVNFVPKFHSEAEEKLYKLYLMESYV